MIASPQTVGNEIQKRIFALLESSATFISPKSPEFVSIHDDLDKLGKVDAARRSVLLIDLYALCGDREEAEYYLRNARKIHADPVDVALAQLTMLVNLGYYVESVPVLRYLSNPELGQLSQLLLNPPGNGAYRLLSEMLEQGLLMKLPNITESTENIAAVARVMDQWGDTDDDYARALEVAGTIMRERKLLHRDYIVSKAVENAPDGGSGFVKLSYSVAVDLDTAIEMTCEYADRLAASRKKIPASLIFEFEPEE